MSVNVEITVIDTSGDRTVLSAPVGERLMPALRDASVGVEAICGGQHVCGTCHVSLEESLYSALPEMIEEEDELLDVLDTRTSTSRLSCQIEVTPEFEGTVFRVCESE